MSAEALSSAIFVAHWLIMGTLFTRVILRRPPIGFSMAWLTVIASTPFLGAAVYLMFGERRLGRQRAARIASNIGDVRSWQARLQRAAAAGGPVAAQAEPLRRQAERVLGFPAERGNAIELFDDFQAVFDALVADIDGAAHRCHLCFYIWHEGGRTADVVDALVRASERGVRCKALVDAIGSRAFLGGVQARRLRSAGVELSAALPTGPLRTFFVRRDLRNHRKIVVIDDQVAYTGSQNLVDPRFFKQDSSVGQWVDAIVRLTGTAAAALDGVFALDWSIETGGAWEMPAAIAAPTPSNGGSTVQVVPSGPDLRPEAIHQLLLTAIYAARSELVMTTPYFVPDEAILTALMSAALSGVQVTLIVPARNDSLLVRHASAACYEDLLAAGVKIALFEGGLLHTKSLTVDGVLSVFGSVNLDMRSLWLNFEISLFIYDSRFTAELKALQTRYLDSSQFLELDVWRQRSTTRRLTENAFRLLGPLL